MVQLKRFCNTRASGQCNSRGSRSVEQLKLQKKTVCNLVVRQIEDRQVFAVDEGAVLDLGQQVVAQVDRRLEGKKIGANENILLSDNNNGFNDSMALSKLLQKDV